MSKWFENANSGIAVSTRVRIARNLADTPFPNRMSVSEKNAVNKKIVDAVKTSNSPFANDLEVVDMKTLSETEALSMVERHIISPEFAKNRDGKVLLLNHDESVSIMLCEEDHIRIQVLKSGLCLNEAYDIADKIDTLLSENLNFAFNDKLGYLTACPTNLGTGLRAGVMLHLPFIENTNELQSIASSISKIGLTVRGLYGEGTKSKASLYQLSNQVTLGITEKGAIDNLNLIVAQIIKKEESALEKFDKIELEDTVFRSLGVLKNARLLPSEEMMKNISNVLLGQRLGMIDFEDKSVLLKLLINTQPATLMGKQTVSLKERDIKRAEIIRNSL